MSRDDAELVADAIEHLAILRRHVARGDLADETVAEAARLGDAPS